MTSIINSITLSQTNKQTNKQTNSNTRIDDNKLYFGAKNYFADDDEKGVTINLVYKKNEEPVIPDDDNDDPVYIPDDEPEPEETFDINDTNKDGVLSCEELLSKGWIWERQVSLVS